VQVHVDKPWQHVAAGEVQDLIGRWRRLIPLAKSGHMVILDEQPGRLWRAGGTGPDRRPGEQPTGHRHQPPVGSSPPGGSHLAASS
jgi:hypothetical protein